MPNAVIHINIEIKAKLSIHVSINELRLNITKHITYFSNTTHFLLH